MLSQRACAVPQPHPITGSAEDEFSLNHAIGNVETL
jgi:hypothetical protein